LKFIDIEGASGARYRFRLLPQGCPELCMPGNYAFVRRDGERFTVLEVGESLDLSLVRPAQSSTAEERATEMFTRLNVPKAIRLAEHEDLAARHQTAAFMYAAE
jgi:hypothetical protein